MLGDKSKVTPEVLQSILLDEISGKLSMIQDRLDKGVALSTTRSVEVSVTDMPVEVNIGEWIRATLYNDGDSDVRIYDTWQMPDTRDAPLKKNNSLLIDKGQRTTDKFYLVCNAGGTATVRVFHIG